MMAPVISSWFGRGQVEASPDIASASLRSDRFRLEREGDWKRLEAILVRMEKGGLRRIPDDDLIALPALYRTAASSLSVARETSLDAATLAYLEALVQRAWFQVYGPRMGFVRWLRGFRASPSMRESIEVYWDRCLTRLFGRAVSEALRIPNAVSSSSVAASPKNCSAMRLSMDSVLILNCSISRSGADSALQKSP